MADDLAVEFFKTARSQCEQTTRWHLIVLAALLYFHVGIVAPFAAKSAERAAIDHNLAQQRAVAAAVAPVARLTKDLADKVDASAKEVSGALLSDLVERFGKLHEVVATLTGMGEEGLPARQARCCFRSQSSSRCSRAGSSVFSRCRPISGARSRITEPTRAPCSNIRGR